MRDRVRDAELNELTSAFSDGDHGSNEDGGRGRDGRNSSGDGDGDGDGDDNSDDKTKAAQDAGTFCKAVWASLAYWQTFLPTTSTWK